MVGFCFSAPALQARVLDCEVDGKSVNPSNGHTTAGLTGMMRCVDRDSKLPAREQELKNGRFEGLERSFENGKLMREATLDERGNKQGVAREFSPASKLLSEEFYQSGSNLGLQKYFYESGAIKRLSYYDMQEPKPAREGGSRPQFIQTTEIASLELNEQGQLSDMKCSSKAVIRFQAVTDSTWCGFEGQVVTELFSRGKLSERRTVLRGETLARDSFNDQGKLRFQAFAQDGRLIERRFNAAGIKVKEIANRKVGELRLRELEQDFHDSGTLVAERRWLDGKLASEATWYLNGQPKRLETFSATGMVRKDFHDSGKPSFEGRFLTEGRAYRAQGEHRFFDDKGAPIRIVSFDERGKMTREREMDSTGKILKDDEVFEDGSRKALAR
jgi:antitoxin component YwqK of YwqJK toxin-antitoxin module